jgi:hypothetical protein
MVDNVDLGITLIKQRLQNLRVHLVLDDVNHSIQLEKLAGEDDHHNNKRETFAFCTWSLFIIPSEWVKLQWSFAAL